MFELFFLFLYVCFASVSLHLAVIWIYKFLTYQKKKKCSIGTVMFFVYIVECFIVGLYRLYGHWRWVWDAKYPRLQLYLYTQFSSVVNPRLDSHGLSITNTFIISFTLHTSLFSWNPLTHNPSHRQRSIHHHQAQPLQTVHHHRPLIKTQIIKHYHQALGQISPSLCLYCVSVYGLFDFSLSLWLVYYVLQSCNGGCGGRLLDWVVVGCCIGR